MKKVLLSLVLMLCLSLNVSAQLRFVEKIYQAGVGRNMLFDYTRGGRLEKIAMSNPEEVYEYKHEGNTCYKYINGFVDDKKVGTKENYEATIEQTSLASANDYKATYTLYGEYLPILSSIDETYKLPNGETQTMTSWLVNRDKEKNIKKVERVTPQSELEEISFKYTNKEYKSAIIDVVNFALSQVVGDVIFSLWEISYGDVHVGTYSKLPKEITYKLNGKNVKKVKLSYDLDDKGYIKYIEVSMEYEEDRDILKNKLCAYLITYYKD